jgi:molybdenum-dependent DNA-binding transcriptional regulator ModE
VVELLVKFDEDGSLAPACAAIGSYRHVWQLLREGEALCGQPLLVMSPSMGSQLAPTGTRLV